MTITKETVNRLDSGAYVCQAFLKTNDGTPMLLEYLNNGPVLKQFVKASADWKVILTTADVGVKFGFLTYNNCEEEWAKIKDAFFATFQQVLGFAFNEVYDPNKKVNQ